MKRLLLLVGLCGCATAETDPFLAFPSGEEVTPEYDRRSWRYWIDADKNCRDTRQEVLVAEATGPLTFKTERECKVVAGEWKDPYTGRTFTDPGLLDIDHMVALRDAHDSGGYAWDADKKKAFANDLEDPNHLKAVYRSANRSKGSRGPDEWLPENEPYRCQYIRDWMGVKKKWELAMTDREAEMVEYQLKICDSGCVPPQPQ